MTAVVPDRPRPVPPFEPRPIGADVHVRYPGGRPSDWIVRVRSCPDGLESRKISHVRWQVWADHQSGNTVPVDMPRGAVNAYTSLEAALTERDRIARAVLV